MLLSIAIMTEGITPEGIVRQMAEGKPAEDTLREIRSMLIVSFPCPPLPIITTKEVEGDTNTTDGEYHTSNSHDLLAHMLNRKTALQNQDDDTHRKVKQERALHRLVHKFDDWKNKNGSKHKPPIENIPSTDVTYGYFAQFFREYMQAFINSEDIPDIRTKNASEILESDPICMDARKFAQAQDVLYGESEYMKSMGGAANLSYEQLLQVGAMRIIQDAP